MWRRKQGWEWCLWNKKTRIANSHQKLEVDPLGPLEPCQHFNFGLLTFRPVRKFISFVLSHLVGSNLLQQPSVQSLSCVQLFATQWTAAHQVSLSITNPGAYANSCSLSRWCHPTISSSVIPFSSRLQSFPASGSFPMSQFCASGDQSIGVSASASVLPMNIQDWFPLAWTVGSPCSPRDSQESSPTPQFKSINSSVLSFLYSPTLTFIHDYWKNHSFD